MSSTTLRRVVVVGGGIAGLTACETLRERGFDGELVVVGSESHAAYSRPALSKALLKLDGDLSAHELAPATHGAREVRGVSAIGVDADRRTITLDDGTELPFDGLVIASGSRARRLSDHPGELTLRGLDDAHALRDRLADQPDVVVLGGGVLGMEIASGAVTAGCRVTLIATSPPMSRQLGAHVSGILTESATAQGLHIVVTDTATVDADGDRAVVRTGDGRVFGADALISAVGDLPNTEWLSSSGLLRDGHLRTDDRGLVAPGIVAAGDVARWGRDGVRTPLWTSAIEQAKAAASALLDAEAPELRFQNYFWTEQFGHSLKAVGPLPVQGAPEVLIGEPDATPALLRWQGRRRIRSVIAIDHRIPIPRLRRLTDPASD
ncbi:FAD-dependent oxidoreductase [Microbacterium sp. Bi121]|uniref:NAD(P)/FAD-dependent oxidoreductase n=1 Tax=Microbacterium sp. Bi121 TaxID=2822348 RepID=UPI001D95C7FE|nr:FAD-dependent oxidoreductase [Microbacterium sp. Bi121]CAH0146220.1 Benzene 1,2-dioxygenase system ferredoxin--NAD(+) reductase subunit [Microbacterium sp. Bi121]